ncbi:MAG: hypothetical protein O6952_05800 [Planctomycetota bacterium]|nr:hypothetical protein [Planctomycetota bacterium]
MPPSAPLTLQQILWADFKISFGLIAAMIVVFYIGKKLAEKGDRVARVSGLGGSWVGLVLLACATSMPELVTGVATAGVVGAPDLAVGNIMGSCLFNLAIIALMDLLWRKGPVLLEVSRSQERPALFGIALLCLGTAGLYFVAPGRLAQDWGFGFGAALVIGYFVSVRMLFEGKSSETTESAEDEKRKAERSQAFRAFGWWALWMVLAGLFLSWIGDEISRHKFGPNRFMFGATWVGTFFLAFATSLPELSVSISAVRLGAVEMAVGNVLGSNLFNLAILPICETTARMAQRPAVFFNADPIHLLTAGASILMTAVVYVAIKRRSSRQIGGMAPETILVAIIYVAASVGIFIFS